MPVIAWQDLRLPWVCRILREQLRALDGHSVAAGAALRRLHVDKSLLERMKRGRLGHAMLLRRRAREDPSSVVMDFASHISDRHDAGADFDAVCGRT